MQTNLLHWFSMRQETGLSRIQRVAMAMMGSLIMLTFLMSSSYAQWWQVSQWLVGSVLPGAVITLTNTERVASAQLPLRRNELLDAAATRKAEHMARHGYFAHYAPDGTTPWEFFDQVGYVYAHAGENLAVHFNDSAAVVAAWMDSPAHRENIINQQFTEIGVGTARGRYLGYDTVFVVQLFGTPGAPPPPVVTPSLISVIPESVDPVSTSSLVAITAETASVAPVAVVLPTATAVDPSAVSQADHVDSLVEMTTTTIPTELSSSDSLEIDAIPLGAAPISEPLATALRQASTNTTAFGPLFLSISTGLAPIPVAFAEANAGGTTLAMYATQPHKLLQITYTMFSLIIMWLLGSTLTRNLQQRHIVRASYSILLLLLMGGLVYLHIILTSNVVIA